MRKIIAADEKFERMEMPRSDALGLCEEMGQAFKVEHIRTGLAGDPISNNFYEFEDVTRDAFSIGLSIDF